MFRDLIPLLSDRYRVIAPDYPGFGHSGFPGRDSFSYTFDGLADAVEKLLERLGIGRFVAYVMDFGAPIGFRLALRDPQRLLALVLQNAPVFPEPVVRRILTDLPEAEYHAVDSGHFALEDRAAEIAEYMRDFLGRVEEIWS
jgi:pimeloyl-ACP methyl ester carboxylesterase